MSLDTYVRYTDEYKTACKHGWYSAGRPKEGDVWLAATPEDEKGRKPGINVLRKWKAEMMWDFWADDMDSRSIAIAENSLVQQKADMLQRQAEMARQLQDKGLDYIQSAGFDNSSSAVQAIIRGAELERTSRGIGEMIVKMATMGDSELKDEIMKMINRGAENDQIVDVEEVPEKKEGTDESV